MNTGKTRRDTGCEGEFDAALAFKALGHPVRMSIMRCLASRNACCCGEVCAELPLAQSTVSQHLDLLRKAGLVTMRQEGTRSRYELDRGALAAMEAALAEFGTGTKDRSE
jgi:ArsR family transcriptional regulator